MYRQGRGEAHMTSSRFQPVRRAKQTCRPGIRETLQPPKGYPVGDSWQRRALWVGDSLIIRGSLEPLCEYNGEGTVDHRVGSAACRESTSVKVGKVSRVAEALRTAKARRISADVKSQRAGETDRWAVVSQERSRQHNPNRSQGSLG